MLCLLFLAGCEAGISADELEFKDNEQAVQEYKQQVEMTEQIRAEERAQDEKVISAAKARDVGPLNEQVRHRQRAAAGNDATSVVDIGPASEIERHRQGGCVTCGK